MVFSLHNFISYSWLLTNVHFTVPQFKSTHPANASRVTCCRMCVLVPGCSMGQLVGIGFENKFLKAQGSLVQCCILTACTAQPPLSKTVTMEMEVKQKEPSKHLTCSSCLAQPVHHRCPTWAFPQPSQGSGFEIWVSCLPLQDTSLYQLQQYRVGQTGLVQWWFGDLVSRQIQIDALCVDKLSSCHECFSQGPAWDFAQLGMAE